VTLFHGDAREVLPTLTERGVVIFDPPYREHTHAKSRAGTNTGLTKTGSGKVCPANFSRAAEFGFGHLSPRERSIFASHVRRLAARWALVFSDVESATWWRLSLQAAGLEYARTGFWRKVGGTPQFTGDRPAVCAEAITICHPKGRKRWNGGGAHGLWDEDFAPGETLWWDEPIVLARGGEGAKGEPRLHTTQKPEALMLALVGDFSDPGEIVYDFTMGSGTTGIGCLRAPGGHRRFVGIEREEKWIEAAAKRLDAELSGSTYHAAKAGQQPLFGSTT
jgi:site-specific DNA-methyltransferase (adenine-specific)